MEINDNGSDVSEVKEHAEKNIVKSAIDKSEIVKDSEVQELVWERLVHAIKSLLGVSISSFEKLGKSLMREVAKKSQDLDLILMNFVLKVLLPSSASLSTSLQTELITIIDSCCTPLSTSLNVPNTTEFLPKFCINTLIDLCDSREAAATEFISVKQKVASITTKVLIERCKAILRKYIADEKRSEENPLPR
eukprot:TRINITY_DN15176_c0_g1_i3.p2 TRINITY_DN15176_c0_g1~~TRINITY_DN15176_c0_g1_i3.p2  ORF type:complete len:192 (+),score=39.47 TRINITY_DN15176_c0_g1_i3:105-680(+)